MRGSPAVAVMRPAVLLALKNCTFGFAQFTLLKRLNASTRSSMRRPGDNVDVAGEREVGVPEARTGEHATSRVAAATRWRVGERRRVKPLQLCVEASGIGNPGRIVEIRIHSWDHHRPLVRLTGERIVAGHRRRERRTAARLEDQADLPILRDRTHQTAAHSRADEDGAQVEEMAAIVVACALGVLEVGHHLVIRRLRGDQEIPADIGRGSPWLMHLLIV